MAEQLVLDIYDIDNDATKNAVVNYLIKAREYQITEFIPEEASITATHSVTPRSYTGLTTDQTGRLATYNVDEQLRRKKHIERTNKAISRLSERQKYIICTRYIDNEDLTDYEVAEQLGYSVRHYRRIKSKAIYRLATMLGLMRLNE